MNLTEHKAGGKAFHGVIKLDRLTVYYELHYRNGVIRNHKVFGTHQEAEEFFLKSIEKMDAAAKRGNTATWQTLTN